MVHTSAVEEHKTDTDLQIHGTNPPRTDKAGVWVFFMLFARLLFLLCLYFHVLVSLTRLFDAVFIVVFV